jgi:hypothetical protein
MPDRTEVWTVAPAPASGDIAVPPVVPPGTSAGIDEERTLVRPAQKRGPQRSAPASPQVEPTVVTIAPREPVHPAIQAPSHQPPPPTLHRSSTQLHRTGGALRTTLITVNVCLGLAVLIRLLFAALA